METPEASSDQGVLSIPSTAASEQPAQEETGIMSIPQSAPAQDDQAAPVTVASKILDGPIEVLSRHGTYGSILPPEVDPTKQQVAYGRRGIPKLITELVEGGTFEKQRALVTLAGSFHVPENISQGLSEDIVPKLVSILTDADVTVRQKSIECLFIIAGHAIGREAIVASDALLVLPKLFEDTDNLVRRFCHQMLFRLTLHKACAEDVLNHGLFTQTLSFLLKETLEIQVTILDTLYNLIRHGEAPWIPADPMENNAIGVFTKLIRPEMVTEVKVGAAKCIMMLCFYADAKRVACAQETVASLIILLKDRKSEVRAAAAGALMSITIDCDAKRLVVRENAVPILMDLLTDQSESVLLNIIKCITNCAEDYRGRFQLHSCLKKLEDLKKCKNPQVAQASKRAIEVITWRP